MEIDLHDIKNVVTIINKRLYFTVFIDQPLDGENNHFFSIDNIFQYKSFSSDFGPLDIAFTYRFCILLNNKLKNLKYNDKRIIFYCDDNEQLKSNAAVLIGIYQIMYMRCSATDVWNALSPLQPFCPYRDASPKRRRRKRRGKKKKDFFQLTVEHVLKAFEKALTFGWIDFDNFNADEYEDFSCIEKGGLNTIVPNKFIAFITPTDDNQIIQGYRTLTPNEYFSIFEKYNVKTIIRLNKKLYNKKYFTDAGYKHHDLFFIDNSSPTISIIKQFLKISEDKTNGVIAVHCKGGLGRTCTLIGCYIMKHYKFTHAETIAWIRLCRPGSILGAQQNFLQRIESKMWVEAKDQGFHNTFPKNSTQFLLTTNKKSLESGFR